MEHDNLTDEQFAEMVEAQCSPAAKRIAELERENEKLRKTLLFVRDECDWETPRGDFGGGGDDRIGPAITSALANVEPRHPAKNYENTNNPSE